MSYTSGIVPEDVEIVEIAYVGEDEHEPLFAVRFTCPRCGHTIVIWITVDDLFYGFEAECNHPTCRKPNERAGYVFYFEPTMDGRMLGLNDRPLHEEEDNV